MPLRVAPCSRVSVSRLCALAAWEPHARQLALCDRSLTWVSLTRSQEDDTSSTASGSSRKSTQKALRSKAASRPRQPAGQRRGGATLGDYIGQAFERAEASKPATDARAARSARRTSGEGALPPLVERLVSHDSPMSGVVEPAGVAADGLPLLPDSIGAASTGGAAATVCDSSDEEDAHKRPASAPEAPIAPQPMVLFPPPGLQLGAAAAELQAAGLAQDMVLEDGLLGPQPRTTRASGTKSHGRRQSLLTAEEREEIRQQNQREKRQRDREAAVLGQQLESIVEDRKASIFDLLMAEFAMDPEHRADPGVMRSAYLKQLYVDERDRAKSTGARLKGHVPQQLGVKQLAFLAEVLATSAELREKAMMAIDDRKIVYAESLSGMPPFEIVQASPGQTLMELMTETRLVLQPKLGRVPDSVKAGGPLGYRKSRKGKGRKGMGEVTLDWRELEHMLRVYAANVTVQGPNPQSGTRYKPSCRNAGI